MTTAAWSKFYPLEQVEWVSVNKAARHVEKRLVNILLTIRNVDYAVCLLGEQSATPLELSYDVE